MRQSSLIRACQRPVRSSYFFARREVAQVAEEARKRKPLEAAGWQVGSAGEFLRLKPEEAALVEMKLNLARRLRDVRTNRGLSQAAMAKLLGSSQSRVAKMEAGDSSVSVDLLVRSLLLVGASRAEIAREIGRRAA